MHVIHLLTALVLVAGAYSLILPAPFKNGRPRDGLVGSPPVAPGVALPDAQYYEFQRVNHFDGSDTREWKQRYFVNATFHVPDGPIFLMLGGEAAANPVWVVDGTWVEWAQRYRAVLVLLEHRYYGLSHPTHDLSTKSLEYLSSRQALADAASFVTYFRGWHHVPHSKLIVFGGSYAGSLAAWFRSKYPELVDGAVASSAPLQALMSYEEYYVNVGNSLDMADARCKAAVKSATDTMYAWYGQPDKRPVMDNMFKLCRKIDHDNLMDLTMFFYQLAWPWADVVQYNHDNRHFEGATGTNLTTDTLCDIMVDASRGSYVQRYADVSELMLKTFGETCVDIEFQNMLRDLNYTHWNSSSNDGSRQWLYQTCSEFGWFQTSWSMKQPFSVPYVFPFNFTTDQCIAVFNKIFGGEEVQENCEQTNLYYGGVNMTIPNVVYVTGSQDPWRSLFKTRPVPDPEKEIVIHIDGTAHCADMYPPRDSDSPHLADARRIISDIIGTWISK